MCGDVSSCWGYILHGRMDGGDASQPNEIARREIYSSYAYAQRYLQQLRIRSEVSTAATHTLRGIAPARRKAEFFLSRLDPLTTVEDILSHVKAYLKSNDVQCERLQTRYNSYASFRVTVDNRFYKRMINAGMWPEYVVFRRYFPPRNL